MSVFNEGSVFA